MEIFKFWDKAGTILGLTPFHPQYFILKAIKESEKISLSKLKGKKVIDIGCGKQKLRRTVEKMGLIYISLDHPIIYKGQRSTLKPDILADINSIPLPKNSVDSALLFMVLDDLANPEKGLNEVKRILKKNGRVHISATENYPAHDLPNDYFRFRLSGIISLCQRAGFKIIESQSWGNIWQVEAVNLNVFLFQTAKAIWNKTKFLPLLILTLVFFYPLTVIVNLLAICLTTIRC